MVICDHTQLLDGDKISIQHVEENITNISFCDYIYFENVTFCILLKK